MPLREPDQELEHDEKQLPEKGQVQEQQNEKE